MDKKVIINKDIVMTEATMYSQLSNLYCSYSSRHSACSTVYANIKANLSLFSNYNNLLTQFINSASKDYYGVCATTYASCELFRTLLDLADIESLDNNTFKSMSLNIKFLDILTNHIVKIKKISSNLINKIIFSENKILIEKILFNGELELNFIPEHLELICSNSGYFYGTGSGLSNNYKINNNITINEFHEFSNKLITEFVNRKTKVTKNAILMAITHNLNLPTIKTLLTLGPVLCEDYLTASCFVLNKDIIDFLLDNKLVPTSKCMQAIFARTITDDLFEHKISHLKISNINKNFPYSIKDIVNIKKYSNIIETLLKYNYKLTYQDVLDATELYIQIDNIEKYNINFDSKFLEICSGVGFYPNYKHNIKADVKCLQKECVKSGNLTSIKELVNKLHIKPDAICMQNACKFRSNLQTIKFLFEKGAPIDHIALKNITYSNGNSSMNFVVDEFIRSFTSKNNKQDENVKHSGNNLDYEYDISSDNLSDISHDNLSDNESVVSKKEKPIEENISQKLNNKNEVFESKPAIIKKETEKIAESESEDDSLKPKHTKKVIIKKKKKPEEIKIDDEKIKETTLSDNIIVKNESIKVETKYEDYKTIKTKITAKDEIKLSTKFTTFFNLEKDIKLTVLTFKKILFNYLNNNKLIKKDSFEVELSSELCETIGFDKKKYGNKLNLKDIDIFCLYILDIQ